MSDVPTVAVAVPTIAPAAPVVVHQLETAVSASLEHANKAGVKTSEFWAPIIAPVVSFALATVSAAAVAHGLGSSAEVAGIVGPAAGSITAAAAGVAAAAYVRARSDLKVLLARL